MQLAQRQQVQTTINNTHSIETQKHILRGGGRPLTFPNNQFWDSYMYISYERSTGLSREYQSVPLTLDTPATCATCFAMNLHRWDHHYSCPHSWQMMYKSMSTVSCTFRPLLKRVRCSKCRFIRDKILKKNWAYQTLPA